MHFWMNPKFFRHFVFPAYHCLKRTGVIHFIAELDQNQWLDQIQLKVLQQNKLHDLLSYAYKAIPFYKTRFDASGFSPGAPWDYQNFLKIPLLTKEDINNNIRELIATSGNGKKLIPNSTSGSTGEKLTFYHDYRSAYYRKAVEVRNQEWLGIRIGDRSARLWGAPMDLDKAQTIRGRAHGWMNNILFLSSYNLSQSSLKEYTEKLLKFKPKLLISYPGPIKVFSEYLLQARQSIPSIKAIICSAETLFSWQREIIEKAFGCSVYNRYGCREFGDIAQECHDRKGLHMHTDRFFIEVLDDSGMPVQPGQTGDVVITDLDNYGMPFIRYYIGDRASIKDDKCTCGRSLPLMGEIEGRTLDIVKAPNGNQIGGTFWTLLFRSRPGISSFQVIQEEPSGIIINYIPQGDKSEIDLSYFTNKIKEKCGTEMKIAYVPVDSIPKTPAGKIRFVVSNLKNTQ